MTNVTKILEKSHYQTFDLIPGDKRDSDSKGKFECSKLSNYNLEGKTILDIGCNAGYFLFKLLDKNPKQLVGIEIGEKFVQIANDLNREIYKSSIIEFILGDFFTHQFSQKFDLIICFSTFHYFKDNQLFFDKCYELLNEGGILLLEVEEYPENSLNLKTYYAGKYYLTNKYNSIKQISHQRWFYELKKPKMSELPSLDKRQIEGDYQKTIIVLTGPSNIGKSTITELLLTDKFDYVSIDFVTLKAELPEIQSFIASYGPSIHYDLGKLFGFVRQNCPDRFITCFFNKYVKENNNLNIFIEGYLFMLTSLYKLFLDKCRENNYRVWNIGRII